jgi:hypothetical protein
MSARTRNVSMFFLLLTVIVNMPSSVHAYTFSSHLICRGWTEDRTPILADRYLPGDTVYLYFEVNWANSSEAESTSFKIQLSSPRGEVIHFHEYKTYMYSEQHSNPGVSPGVSTSGFLEILNVTSTTENGLWHLKWFDGATLVFDEEFTVGQQATKTTPKTIETTSGLPPVAPRERFFEAYVLWIIVALGAVAVVVLAFWKTHIAKPLRAPVQPAPEAPGPTAPTQEIVRPAAAKYCIQCGELIPEVAVYCPRCASKQEE